MIRTSDRSRFLIRNLARGLFWLGLLIAAFLIFKKQFVLEVPDYLIPIFENKVLVVTIFLISEMVMGIIPPELFMLWALRNGIVADYAFNILWMTMISWGAGMLDYWLGLKLAEQRYYRLFRKKFFGKYEYYLNEYGGFLIIVAAITPLPYSGICALVGSVRFPFKKFLWYSSFRFLRFIVYSFIIWEAATL